MKVRIIIIDGKTGYFPQKKLFGFLWYQNFTKHIRHDFYEEVSFDKLEDAEQFLVENVKPKKKKPEIEIIKEYEII